MHKYKDLKIWQKSIDLAVSVYAATANYPKEEKYGLTSQTQRSAVSIPSNIAEGAGRNTNPDFCRFLAYANGSSYELETQIVIAERLNFITKERSEKICSELNEIQKMNFMLQQKLEKKN